jgi:hypothetical protein
MTLRREVITDPVCIDKEEQDIRPTYYYVVPVVLFGVLTIGGLGLSPLWVSWLW